MVARRIHTFLTATGGILLGVCVGISLSALAEPLALTGLDTPKSTPEAPWGPASQFTVGGALLLAVWRGGALFQKLMDGGVTVTVKMSDEDVELLTESLQCRHPEGKPSTVRRTPNS